MYKNAVVLASPPLRFHSSARTPAQVTTYKKPSTGSSDAAAAAATEERPRSDGAKLGASGSAASGPAAPAGVEQPLPPG